MWCQFNNIVRYNQPNIYHYNDLRSLNVHVRALFICNDVNFFYFTATFININETTNWMNISLYSLQKMKVLLDIFDNIF